MPNDYGFWTDEAQAAERLQGTFVLDGDSNVVYVNHINGNYLYYTDPFQKNRAQSKPLNSPDWNNFRRLPPLGWHNVNYDPGRPYKPVIGAMYLRRRALRARSHGLNNNNVTVLSFAQHDNALTADPIVSVAAVYGDPLFNDPGKYPSFEEAFGLLRPRDSAALSNKFALYQDKDGLTWLWRKRNRIALVPDNATILLLRSMRFYIDDLNACQHTLFPGITYKEL